MTVPAVGSFPTGLFVEQRYETSGPPGILAYGYDLAKRDLLSLTEGVDPIDDQVVVALTAYRMSGAAVANVGARWFDIEKLDEKSTREIEGQARLALRTLIQNADILLVSLEVEVDSGDQQANILVKWRNLRAIDRIRVRDFRSRVNVRRPEAIRLKAA